ncbi:LacI family transcriptional regulator [Desemzia sp. C1]|uniref:LacI family DNA-binding transcriptional regulator n=1 Tax=Desemzia sp. C1 TaxID=2892016 RepID=UPI001E557A4D|nr:LacI family DNA-binding transcriptional regulator [Desemzia sp. C1]MCI3027967.1 LacI family transcriptional regulator [Desemzia sp. C1]
MVGIKDIAKKAGVSISTVSYALNGSSKVTEDTREKILLIAKDLNYIPNMAGRNLRRNKSNIIGVYLSSYSGTFYGDLLDGIMKEAKNQGYEMVACSGDRSRLFLPQGMIDGAIIIDPAFPDEKIKEYADRGSKIVVLDRKLKHENVRQVLLDNRHGGKLAIDALTKTSADFFYLVSGPMETFDSNERLEGAEEVLSQKKLEYQVLHGDFTETSGRILAEKIHREWTKPVGIFSLNDEMAFGMYDYFQETDIEIGKDVFIAGFDHTLISKYAVPSLATISYSKQEWAFLSAKTLFALLDNKPVKDKILPTSFILGDSLGF